VSVLDPSAIAIAEPPEVEPLARGDVARELGSLALEVAEQSADEAEDDGGISSLATDLLEIAAGCGSRERALERRTRAGAARSTATRTARPRSSPRRSARRPRRAGAARRGSRCARGRGRRQGAGAFSAARSRSTSDRPPAGTGWAARSARAGDADGAFEALTRARQLAWSSPLDLELGRLHVAARRADEARKLLQPLAADPHGGGDREEGRRAARAARCAAGVVATIGAMRRFALLGLAWALGCASGPANTVKPGLEGAPGSRAFVVCPPNTVISLPAEMQNSTARVRDQIDAYLRFHDRNPQSLDLFACRKLWTEAMAAAKEGGALEQTPAFLRPQARRGV
jgi:hypothetical protein